MLLNLYPKNYICIDIYIYYLDSKFFFSDSDLWERPYGITILLVLIHVHVTVCSAYSFRWLSIKSLFLYTYIHYQNTRTRRMPKSSRSLSRDIAKTFKGFSSSILVSESAYYYTVNTYTKAHPIMDLLSYSFRRSITFRTYL